MSLIDEDFSSDSDDVDYIPAAEEVSEEENSGEEEDLSLLQDGESGEVKGKRKRGRKGKATVQSRKRKGGIRLEGDEGGEEEAEDKGENKELAEQIKKEEEAKKAEREKKKADDIWASFMAGVEPSPKRQPATSSGLGALCSSTSKAAAPAKPAKAAPALAENSSSAAGSSTNRKVTVTQVFDFAGEEVRVSKEVAADSKEGKAELERQRATEEEKAKSSSPSSSASSSESSSKPSTVSSPGVSAVSSSPGLNVSPASAFFPTLPGRGAPTLKRPLSGGGGGGLSSVLSKIGKKPKMTTLEKSRMDWEGFKKDEGIDEDLKIYNRGKGGYMERKAFLERTDQRQFEIEKGFRQNSRNSNR